MRDGQIAPARLRRPAAVGQHAAAADQKDGGDQPQRCQRGHGYAENALGVARIIARYIMRHHARDGYRNARRGDGQQQVIGGKNLGINADALAANVGRQRDTIEHADHLADQPSQTQDGNAADKRLGFLRHGNASQYILSLYYTANSAKRKGAFARCSPALTALANEPIIKTPL